MLFKSQSEPGAGARAILFFVGILFTPLTLAGALWGYVRGYNAYLKGKERPNMAHLPPNVLAGMVIFAVIAWFIVVTGAVFIFKFYGMIFGDNATDTKFALALFVFNTVLTAIVFLVYGRWQMREYNIAIELGRHGSARLAKEQDMKDLNDNPGLFIGGSMGYIKQGHILTVGATRSGKGVNLIIPALLDRTRYTGSFVIIDPKGENAAITARFQTERGQKVMLLDPWALNTKDAATYNPMDILKPGDELADDAMMLAEMIVPSNPNEHDPFWSDRARSIVAGLIMHIHQTGGTLIDLWRSLRLASEEWIALVAKMQVSQNEVVSSTGNEIEAMMQNEKVFGSVMASALQHTDFLKSPALQRSLAKSSFNVNELSNGDTTLYVIIPADKLKSHYQWLRLVVTTSIKATVRHYNKRVTFILDEFPSLGPLKEVSEFGLAAAAGFNISFWMIAQSLPQLKSLYGDNWENFIANTTVRQYVGIQDNFTADYVSHSIGNETVLTYKKATGEAVQSTARPLIAPEQMRNTLKDNMIIQVENRDTLVTSKVPYWHMLPLVNRHDENPYRKQAPPTQAAA